MLDFLSQLQLVKIVMSICMTNLLIYLKPWKRIVLWSSKSIIYTNLRNLLEGFRNLSSFIPWNFYYRTMGRRGWVVKDALWSLTFWGCISECSHCHYNNFFLQEIHCVVCPLCFLMTSSGTNYMLSVISKF